MKKNLTNSGSIILSALLLFSSCQKQINEPSPKAIDLQAEELQSKNDHDGNKNKCRLTEFIYDGGSETFHYNRKGLCDEWNIVGLGAVLKEDYDATGQLKKSRWYEGNELIYTIHFFYKGGKVTKEIWYDGSTSNVSDEVYYTYNRQGQNTRMESFLGAYYTLNTFDGAGNVTAWDTYIGGNLTYSSRSTFGRGHSYKNPRRSVSGIDYGFPFFNGAEYANAFCISSQKLIAYDENGNPVVLFNYDPKRTSYQPASQNYPSSGTFFDLVTNDWTSQTFQYENCGGDRDNDYNKSQKAASSTAPGASNTNLMMLLIRNPSKSMKEQVKQLRQKYLNIQ